MHIDVRSHSQWRLARLPRHASSHASGRCELYPNILAMISTTIMAAVIDATLRVRRSATASGASSVGVGRFEHEVMTNALPLDLDHSGRAPNKYAVSINGPGRPSAPNHRSKISLIAPLR